MAEYSSGFQRWWECYPPHKKKGKGAAFASWKKHNCEPKAEELIRALQQQVDFDDHFKKYTPLPTTYINQGRYDDDIPKPKRAQAPSQKEDDGPRESCPVQARVNALALNWLWRRGGIPDGLIDEFRQLVRVLGSDVRMELQEATDEEKERMSTEVPKRIYRNLADLANGRA